LRRGIDQDIELERSQSLPHLFRLPKIELRVIESNDVIIVCVLPRQGRAKTTTGSDNDYTPLRLHRIGFKKNRARSSRGSQSKTSKCVCLHW
jgi:hypothetical protein